jgi:hypothetical protein
MGTECWALGARARSAAAGRRCSVADVDPLPAIYSIVNLEAAKIPRKKPGRRLVGGCGVRPRFEPPASCSSPEIPANRGMHNSVNETELNHSRREPSSTNASPRRQSPRPLIFIGRPRARREPSKWDLATLLSELRARDGDGNPRPRAQAVSRLARRAQSAAARAQTRALQLPLRRPPSTLAAHTRSSNHD